jgi:hypothetical protein
MRLALVMVIVGLIAMWGTVLQRFLHTTAPPVAAFDNQWNHAEQNIRIIDLAPKSVKTEPIVPSEPEVKPPEVKIAEAPKQAKSEPEHESNICTRHNMHKVYTHGGRSWRCRR